MFPTADIFPGLSNNLNPWTFWQNSKFKFFHTLLAETQQPTTHINDQGQT